MEYQSCRLLANTLPENIIFISMINYTRKPFAASDRLVLPCTALIDAFLNATAGGDFSFRRRPTLAQYVCDPAEYVCINLVYFSLKLTGD